MSPRHRIPPGNDDLDPLLLDPTRLAIVSVLAAAHWCEFGFVRDTVELTDPALSKQVAKLVEVAYVEVRKGRVGKQPRTWLRITFAGRKQLAIHLMALRKIAAQAQQAGRDTALQAESPGEANEGLPDSFLDIEVEFVDIEVQLQHVLSDNEDAIGLWDSLGAVDRHALLKWVAAPRTQRGRKSRLEELCRALRLGPEGLASWRTPGFF
jgi:DNA-binding transcriptional ArsR family regulator